jgi:hypothetical protein
MTKEIDEAIEAFEWLEKFMEGDTATLKHNERDRGHWPRCMAIVRNTLKQRQAVDVSKDYFIILHVINNRTATEEEIERAYQALERMSGKTTPDTIQVKREDVPEGLKGVIDVMMLAERDYYQTGQSYLGLEMADARGKVQTLITLLSDEVSDENEINQTKEGVNDDK